MAKQSIMKIAEAENKADEAEKQARLDAAEIIKRAELDAAAIKKTAEEKAESIIKRKKLKAEQVSKTIISDAQMKSGKKAADFRKNAERLSDKAVKLVLEELVK